VVTRGAEIDVARADGSDSRRILTAHGILFGAHFSPDGKRIRFTLFETRNTFSLWEVNADGSNLHPLLPGWHTPSTECCGQWSPDGKLYVFMTERKGDLWALPENTSWFPHRKAEPVRLTSGPLVFADPSFDPGGKKLYAVGYQLRAELTRFDPATRQTHPYLSGISAGELAWSRDGQWVAYVSFPDDTLWRCRTDGSEKVQLTNSSHATLPQWSPDGSRIAFVAAVWGKPWKVYLVSAEGGTPQPAVEESRPEVDPTWSPDGKKLMFGRISAQADAEPLAIEMVDLATHSMETLPGSEGRFSPRWSPDGRYVAALSSDSRSLWLYDFRSQQWAQWYAVTDGSVGFPVWSSDSQSLFFDEFMTGRFSEWRIRLGKHTADMVAHLEGEHRFGMDWGSWTGVAPDGSVLFSRDVSTKELYALNLRME